MISRNGFGRSSSSFTFASIIISTALFTPPVLNAQQLEEIIVTAQRREQSLQEVPISLDVFTGADISKQGFNTMEDLSKYSASVIIMDRSNRVNTTIRGFGTVAGSSQTLVSSAPFFVDGIHLGATQMAKVGFLDTERVEILKGPQPLHFGMNAVSGAFNIISRRPSPDWEGDITAEFGNDASRNVSGGFGGPLTETLGIRLAALYEGSDGPLLNIVGGEKYGGGETLGGRILLQWAPNDKIDMVTKFEASRTRNFNDLNVGCLTGLPLTGYATASPLNSSMTEGIDFGNTQAVLAGPPLGLSTAESMALAWYPEVGEGQDCFKSKYGMTRGGPYLAPPDNVTQINQRGLFSGGIFEGMIDARAAADAILNSPDGSISFAGTPNGGLSGKDNNDSMNALVDITYSFDNGIIFNSQTGMIWFNTDSNEENCACPFFTNQDGRGMDLDQFSQNLRLQSRTEGYDLDFAGGTNLEFMLGASYQEWEKDMFDNPIRPNLRTGQRFNNSWEDARWITGMWELTFNFMDKQLSVGVGGRLTKDTKHMFLMGSASQWIFDEIPCDPAGGDANPATCLADPNFKWVNPNLTTRTSFDPSNPAQRVSAGNRASNNIHGVRVDSPVILLNDVDMNNLWTPWRWNGNSIVPLNYRSPGGAIPVGITAPVYDVRSQAGEGPWGDCDSCLADPEMDVTDYNNQFVISYTPNALNGDHTIYTKYAEAFKGPVSDTAQATIPASLSELVFLPEYITAYEVGARGNLLDNRIRYDITTFKNNFKDVQLGAAGTVSDPLEVSSVQLNAAKQVVKGLEFSITTAVTENLTVNLSGALMDGKMAELDGGGCSNDEIIAVSVDAVGNAGGQRGSAPSAAELAQANNYLNRLGPTRRAVLLDRAGNLPQEYFRNGGCRLVAGIGADGLEFPFETISRNGEDAAYTPDWKFVLDVDYRLPVLDTYEVFVNARGFLSDSWIMSSEIFDRSIMYNKHGDLNLLAGFGPQDGNWRVAGFVRNMFEVKPSFNKEYKLDPIGFITAGQESEVRGLGDSAWMSYGIRLEYYYR